MDCIDVRGRLHDLASGRPPAAEREEVQAHLRNCPSCAAVARIMAQVKHGRALRKSPGRSVARGREPKSEGPPAGGLQEPGAKHLRAGPGPLVRVMQVCAMVLLCGIAALILLSRGRWNEFFGIGREKPSAALVAQTPQTPGSDTRQAALELLEEITDTVRAMTLSGAAGEDISAGISGGRLATRLHELRRSAELPGWAASALARIEVVLLRAEAAGADETEWADLRALVMQERLIRACEDVRAYLETAANKR